MGELLSNWSSIITSKENLERSLEAWKEERSYTSKTGLHSNITNTEPIIKSDWQTYSYHEIHYNGITEERGTKRATLTQY